MGSDTINADINCSNEKFKMELKRYWISRSVTRAAEDPKRYLMGKSGTMLSVLFWRTIKCFF